MPGSFPVGFPACSKTYEEINNLHRFLNRSASLTLCSTLEEEKSLQVCRETCIHDCLRKNQDGSGAPQ